MDAIETELRYMLAREAGDTTEAERIRRAWAVAQSNNAERALSLRFLAWCAALSPGIALWTYLLTQLVR